MSDFYRPTPKQQLFHASTADEVLYGGAAGGGKSMAVVLDAFDRCMRVPGVKAYLFRRTYRELEDGLIQLALQYIPSELGRYNGSGHNYTFLNGSQMRFRHCQNDKDRLLYQGAEIDYLYIDELTHFSRVVYDFLKSRLRTTNPGVVPCVRCTSNPGGPGHAWVKDYFIDSAPPGEVQEREIYSETLGRAETRTIQYIPARVIDNPYINAGYIFELESKPKALRDALLHGSWDAFEGQVFSEWRDKPDNYRLPDGETYHKHTHVIDPFPIPHHWQRYCSFDFGYSKPFAVQWWAVDENNVAYLYRQWYGSTGQPNEGARLTVEQIAAEIKKRERDEPRPPHRIADPSIWDASRGESIEMQFARHGVYWARGQNARLPGKQEMHNRLAFDEDGHAHMYVFKTCRDFVRTIPALVYDDTRVEDIDTDGEDHDYDAARYFFMERLLRAKPQPPDLSQWQPPPYDPFRR